MKQLENLKEIADRNLCGLKADPGLLQQIVCARPEPEKRTVRWQPILAVAAAVVFLVCAGLLALPGLIPGGGDMNVVTRSAGGELDTNAVLLTADVPAGSLNISETTSRAPAYRNLFASGQGANFPLVKIGEATYRMLTNPANLSDSLLGESLGSVTEFTEEPSLSASAVVSNAVAADQPVYAVKGMQGAAVAAVVDGSLRVFQRAGFGGVAVLGGETLRDVLLGSAQAVALELTDVGVIDDPVQAEELMNVLLSNARYEGAAESANRSQSLLIWLPTG